MLSEEYKKRLISCVQGSIERHGFQAAIDYGVRETIDILIKSGFNLPDPEEAEQRQNLIDNRKEAERIVAGIFGLTDWK